MMDDYIKRGDVLNAAKMVDIVPVPPTISERRNVIAIMDVIAIPAADVAPVVRCKDCKYALCSCDGLVKYCLHWEGQYDTSDQLYHEPENFCSFGERKDKEANA